VDTQSPVRRVAGIRVHGLAARLRARRISRSIDALEHAGCQRVYQDVGSGSIRSGSQLDDCGPLRLSALLTSRPERSWAVDGRLNQTD
jgi:hypothetical protein